MSAASWSKGGVDARCVPTGHLVFLRLGSLLAIRFDPVRLATVGGVVGLEEGIAQAVGLDDSMWESGPSVLFEFEPKELTIACHPTRCYDVAPGGQGFFAAARVGASVVAPTATHVSLVLNRAEQLKVRVPARR